MLRSECKPGGAKYQRPCPYTGCRYHLAESSKSRHGGRPSTVERDTSETCALDVASDGRTGLVRIGELLGVTRERVRQIETRALHKLARACKREGLDFGERINIKSAMQATSRSDIRVDGDGYDSRGRSRAMLREYRQRHREKVAAGGSR